MNEPTSILNGVVKTSWPSSDSDAGDLLEMLPAIWKAFFLGIVGNIAVNIANAVDVDGLDPLALLRTWGQEQEQAAANALTAANSAQSTATSAQSTANSASTTANTANTNATNALSAAQNALTNAENALTQLGTLIGDVLGGQSTAADLAAFISDLDGIIDPSRIAQVSASAIGAVGTPNLLTNGSFVDSVSMAPEGSGWAWDGTTTHSNTAPSGHTDGSVTTTGTGVQQTLVSNVVGVSAGQSLSVAGWLKWSGVTASSVAFALNVIAYLDGNQVSYQTIGGVVSPAASGSWQEITGTYTVPSGADQVRVQLVVTANVTAGQVWWDDLSLTKTQTIDQSLITSLESDLSTVNTAISNAETGLTQIGEVLAGDAVTAVSTAVSNVQSFFSNLTGWQSTTTANVTAAQNQLTTGNGGQLVSTGVLSGLQYSLTSFTSNGTWTPSTAPSGYQIAYYIVTAYGGGSAGAAGNTNTNTPSPGGIDGGRNCEQFTPSQMGSSQTVTIGVGGSSSSAAGSVSSFGSLLTSVPGTSAMPSQYGDIASSSRPGSGGSGQWGVATPGTASSTAPGGSAGGLSAAAGGAGTPGSNMGYYTTGGSGGGGGGYYFITAGKGGAGAAPGGAGGGGGASSNTNAAGGIGARGQVDVCAYYEPIGT